MAIATIWLLFHNFFVETTNGVPHMTDTTTFQFAVTDRLGREMGIRLKLYENNGLFGYDTQTLRNGNSHQASHGKGRFATAAERNVAAEKAVAAARKRAESPAARLKA